MKFCYLGGMKASYWVWNEAAYSLNREAAARGIETGWSTVQGGSQYAAAGLTVPGLQEFVTKISGKQFQRNHWCVGATAINGREFEVGRDVAKGMYVGIRIHSGGSTPNGASHEAIYRHAVKNLAEIDDHLVWQHRQSGGFWSIFADIPTNLVGKPMSEREYLDTVIDLTLEGWQAVKGLWI
mgnify:CR=1 FL=1